MGDLSHEESEHNNALVKRGHVRSRNLAKSQGDPESGENSGSPQSIPGRKEYDCAQAMVRNICAGQTLSETIWISYVETPRLYETALVLSLGDV